MSLTAEGLRFRWERDGAPAVDGVSLELGPGELVAVVGPNGSGKSSLLALLSGWRRPEAGEVRLGGRPLGALRPRERARRMAFLPQHVVPLYELTVAELVATGRYPWLGGVPTPARGDAAVRRALAAADLELLADRSFGSLSGGERQRALVAATLAQEPHWLLLDEPTAALDLHHAVAIFRVLEACAGRGMGVLVVTHDLNLAALFASRVVLLKQGRLVGLGPPQDVLTGEILRRAYGPEVLVTVHPVTGRPAVLPSRRRDA